MAEQKSRLVIEIDAGAAQRTLSKLNDELTGISVGGKKAAGGITDVGSKANQQASAISTLAAGVKKLAVAYISLQAAQAAAAKADDYVSMQNRLRQVTKSQTELNQAMNDTYKIAQISGSAWDGAVQVYQRFAQNADKLGISMKDVSRLTETTSKAIAMSGASAGAAEASLVQFGQALASGVLRGDEFNSMAEQTPKLLEVIAEGLGVSRGELRELAADGKLTADVVVGALQKMSDKVDGEYSESVTTLAQSMQMLDNATTKMAGELGAVVIPIIGDMAAQIFGADGKVNDLQDSIQKFARSDEFYRWIKQAIVLTSNFADGLITVSNTLMAVAGSVKVVLNDLKYLDLSLKALDTTWVPGTNKTTESVAAAKAELEQFAKKRESDLSLATGNWNNLKINTTFTDAANAAFKKADENRLKAQQAMNEQIGKGLLTHKQTTKELQKQSDLTKSAKERGKGGRKYDGEVYAKPYSGNYRITSGLGSRNTGIPGASTNHKGVDIAMPIGTPVKAMAGGVVENRTQANNQGFGKYVVIKFDNGMTQILGHLSKHLLKSGARVKAGEVVGLSGDTGIGGAHLHNEIRDTRAGVHWRKANAVDFRVLVGKQTGSKEQLEVGRRNLELLSEAEEKQRRLNEAYSDFIQARRQSIDALGVESETEKLLISMRYGAYADMSQQQRDGLVNAQRELEIAEERFELLQLADSRKRDFSDQQFELSLIGQTADEVDRLTLARKYDQMIANAKRDGKSDVYIKGLEAEKVAAEEQRKSIEGQAAYQQFVNQLVGNDELQEYTQNVGMLKRAMEDGYISAEKYRLSVMQLGLPEALKNPDDWLGGLKYGIESQVLTTQSLFDRMSDFGAQTFEQMGDSLANFVATGKMDFRSLTVSILQDLSKMLIKMAVMRALQAAMGMFAGGGSFNVTGQMAGNVALGGGSAAGGYTGLFAGFSGGGYTGAGGKYEPAGIVHRGEVVFSQRDVARHGGVGAVERLRLKGYADGGVVGLSAPKVSAGSGIVVNMTVNVEGGGESTEEDVRKGVEAGMAAALRQIADQRIAESWRPGNISYSMAKSV
ncbi:tape measure protein [Neisseria weixii]|nr:tape measure protein [Neisseria weixii]